MSTILNKEALLIFVKRTDKISELKLSFGWKDFPFKPVKKLVDPNNQISNRNWILNYILPHQNICNDIAKHNSLIMVQITNIMND